MMNKIPKTRQSTISIALKMRWERSKNVETWGVQLHEGRHEIQQEMN